jgi:hypothetical protein
MSPRAPSLVALLGLVLATFTPACAALLPVTVERRSDGIYHLTCRTTLQVCLNDAEDLCHRERYVVLRALDLHDYKGASDKRMEARTSEAFVRCGAEATWGTENKTLLQSELCPAPPAVPAAPVAATPRGCTPGASQACVGPAGCAGGQVCAPDGTKLGLCDCGAPAALPAKP